jgi:hypothetical protein
MRNRLRGREYGLVGRKPASCREPPKRREPFSHPRAEVIQFAAHDEVPLLRTSDTRGQTVLPFMRDGA